MTQPFVGPTPVPAEALRLLVRRLTNLQVGWIHAPQKMLGMQRPGRMAYVLLNLSRVRAIGVDDQREQDDPDGASLSVNIGGQRVLTLVCRVESFDASLQPYDVCERIRWGCRTVAAQSILESAGLAYNGAEAAQYLGKQTRDNREVLVGVIETRFNWAVNATGQAPGDGVGTTINTVDGGTQEPGTAPTIPGTTTPG